MNAFLIVHPSNLQTTNMPMPMDSAEMNCQDNAQVYVMMSRTHSSLWKSPVQYAQRWSAVCSCCPFLFMSGVCNPSLHSHSGWTCRSRRPGSWPWRCYL